MQLSGADHVAEQMLITLLMGADHSAEQALIFN